MSNETALQEAQALLDELIEAAKTGAIIPVRLTGQLEEIKTALERAGEDDPSTAGTNAGSDDGDFRDQQGRFISHAIHELRTPMTSIRGYSDMLGSPSMGELNDMQQQFITTIRTNAKRMEGLLTDVSDINKIRTGILIINPKMDMFKNIAMMVEKQTTPMAEELGRKLTFDIPQGLPLLEVDGEMLAKALSKLVENALRYTPQEDGEITMSAEADGNTLVVKIIDNGIGMKPEEIEQLGTPYFRGDNEVVLSYKGSGLGIPVAYGIINLLGGEISVESTLDEGTTFTVRIKGMG